MVIKRVLTNNSVVIMEDGVEKIVCGKGIAYKKKPGMTIDASLINQTFVLEQDHREGFEKLLKDVPMTYVEIAKEIIDMARTQFSRPISDHVILTLADHLYAAAMRIQEGVAIHNALLWQIQHYYELEYEIGKTGIQLIRERMQITFPEDEAGYIALHIVNAQMDDSGNMNNAYRVTKLIQEITTIVRYFYAIDFDTADIYYYRFITHLKFFALRLFNGKTADGNDRELYELVRHKFQLAYECVQKISDFLQTKYQHMLSEEEMLYLIIHIHRVVTKTKNNDRKESTSL